MVEQGYRRKWILFIRHAAEAILGKQVVNGFHQEYRKMKWLFPPPACAAVSVLVSAPPSHLAHAS
jgi:hypothetical protein